MTEEILRYIREKGLIKEGDTVLAGVSGGADSVCLLLVLQELQKRLQFHLQVVHVEHGIRGEESVEDAKFVKELCDGKGIPCNIYSINVPAYARQEGIGEEEAARTLRYDCYAKEAEKIEKQGHSGEIRIALAHHGDDNAETILFQMIRGSGLDGLTGMQPMRSFGNGWWMIRPLLGQTRVEIEACLEGMGQEFREDSTNSEMRYSRNRIRHEVFPILTQINSQAVAHVNQCGNLLGEIAEYVNAQMKLLSEVVCRWDGNTCCEIQMALFYEYTDFMQREVVHGVISKVAGSQKDITAVHIGSVVALAANQVGKTVSLPYHLSASRIYDGIRIERIEENQPVEESEISFLEIDMEKMKEEGQLEIPIEEGRIQMKVFPFSGEKGEISKKKYTKWLDYDKIKIGMQIRKRKNGDYLTIDSLGHTQKLKEYFINEKIPQKERERTLLFAQESHIIWVVGGRISTSYQVTEDTTEVLEIQVMGGNYIED